VRKDSFAPLFIWNLLPKKEAFLEKAAPLLQKAEPLLQNLPRFCKKPPFCKSATSAKSETPSQRTRAAGALRKL